MIKDRLLCEGKTKKIYSIKDDDRHLIQVFKDDVTAFNGEKHEIINNKGFYCNQISSRIFEHLENNGIHTHYVMRDSECSMLVHKAKPILLEVVVRNSPEGSLIKRLGLDKTDHQAVNQGGCVSIYKQVRKNKFVKTTITELYYKNDELGDPLINDDHAMVYITDENTLIGIKSITHRTFNILDEYFMDLGFKIIDIKFEFGFGPNGEILLIDDISPEGCRLIDYLTLKRFDKDLFRFGVEKTNRYKPLKNVDERGLIGNDGKDFISALASVYDRIMHKERHGIFSSEYSRKRYLWSN